KRYDPNGPAYKRARKALADNLMAEIAKIGRSVNHAALAVKAPQRSVENLTEVATDPRLSTICAVSEAFGLEPWQAFFPAQDGEIRDLIGDWVRLYKYATPEAIKIMSLAVNLVRDEARTARVKDEDEKHQPRIDVPESSRVAPSRRKQVDGR